MRSRHPDPLRLFDVINSLARQKGLQEDDRVVKALRLIQLNPTDHQVVRSVGKAVISWLKLAPARDSGPTCAIDLQRDGCGGQIFPWPIYPEVVQDQAIRWERDLDRLAVLRLEFSREAVPLEDLAAMLSALSVREPIGFEVLSAGKGIVHQIVCQQEQKDLVTDTVRGALGQAALEEIAPSCDPVLGFGADTRRSGHRDRFDLREYFLPAPFFLPLFNHGSGCTGLYEVLSRVQDRQELLALWQVLVVPARIPWFGEVHRYLGLTGYRTRASLATGNLVEMKRHPQLCDPDVRAYQQALHEKPPGTLLCVCLRICTLGRAPQERLIDQLAGPLGGLRHKLDGQGLRWLGTGDYQDTGLDQAAQVSMIAGRMTYSSGMLLSAPEAAHLFPVPPSRVLEDSSYRVAVHRHTRPAPSPVSACGVRLGINIHRGVRQPVIISDERHNQHLYIIGQSRWGKSTLIQNMVLQRIERGQGVTVMDTEGDLIEAVLENIPLSRADDIVLLDLGDEEYAPSYNYLRGAQDSSQARRREHFTESFQRTISPLGDRSQMLLDRTLDALLEVKESSVIDIEPFLRDTRFRQAILRQVKDPMIRRYWLQEFPAQEALLGTSIEALSSRLHHLTGDQRFRACLCQRQNRIHLPEILQQQQTFLVNLNFKQVGRRKGALMGQLLLSELQIAGMARRGGQRVPHYIFADECQNYLCSALEVLLSQGAKYHMHLCLAHQFMGQVGDLAKAILGNVATCIAFRLGPADAQVLAQDFACIEREELTSLPPYHAWVKTSGAVFNLVTDSPQNGSLSVSRMLVERSRHRYSTKRSEISYDPPFLPGYWSSLSNEGLPDRGVIRIDEGFDEL